MMLTNEKISENRQEYINLLCSISREGAKVDDLVRWLDEVSFFVMPASTKYHSSYAGGLCVHSLNVYRNLKELVNSSKDLPKECYNEDTLKIVALLHDCEKFYYDYAVRNKKSYSEKGSKRDSFGAYDWVEERYFTVNQSKKFIYGSHEMNSEFLARCFIPLLTHESIAILHHMGGMAADSSKDDISSIYSSNPLACLLYLADMKATYIDETRGINE